jgi:integrase
MREAFEKAKFGESQRTHALRYTACVRLFEAGYTYEQVAEAAGHSMAQMAKSYCDKKRNAPQRAALIDAIDEGE